MNYSIELMRLLAVILITFTHTRHEFTEGSFYLVIHELPKYGTLILSIISGYLYWKTKQENSDLLSKKIKSLLIPYLIANGVVLFLVLIFNSLGFNFLNRLTYDWSLIWEGLLAFNSPPINPPTYFIRDLFVVFALIALVMHRKIIVLLLVIPLLLWGKIFIRWDIVFLFALGFFYGSFESFIPKKAAIPTVIIVPFLAYFFLNTMFPYFVAFSIFYVMINLKIKFFKVGSFTYLLHLYHSPIMIALFPIIQLYVENEYLKVILQICLSIVLIFIFYKLIKKHPKLNFISGGR